MSPVQVAEAPQCVGSDFRYPRVPLADRSTRRTAATSTGEYPECIAESARTVGSGFDAVQKLVSKLIEKAAGGGAGLPFVDEEGGQVPLALAPHKDHIHVYEKQLPSKVSDNQDHDSPGEYLVPYHVDNGVFLLITPFPGHGMSVELSDGSVASTGGVGRGSVLVLVGLGLTDWLLQGDAAAAAAFHPVPHAVPAMRALRHRSVFARMVVAPAAATPGGGGGGGSLTFGEVFQRRTLNGSRYDSQGRDSTVPKIFLKIFRKIFPKILHKSSTEY